MKKDIYKSYKIPIDLGDNSDPQKQTTSSHEVILKLDLPEVQKAEITNLPEPEPVQFPEIQKVEVVNPPAEPKPIEFPDIQKVKVLNPPAEPKEVDLSKVEGLLRDILEFKETKQKVQKVEVTNPTPPAEKIDIPINIGNKPGKADPSRYIPVRLTDGEKFYKAIESAYVSAAKQSYPFVDSVTGLPTRPTTTSGILNANVSVTANATVTSTSGSPLYNFITNWPTIQQVYTVNPGSATVTTTSGTPLDTFQRNIPTVQTVELNGNRYVQIQPGVTTAVSGSLSLTTTSGSPLNASIVNFPTIATVNVQNMPAVTGSITTLSGSQVDVKNFPTVQTVNVQNMPNVTIGNSPNVTTLSGSQMDIKNFPTVQTVNVQNMPAITGTVTANQGGSWTTASGSIVDVKNFPTVQTVNVQNLPYVQIQPGVTTAVSGSLSLTTTSGSPLNAFITNFPTVQTVNMQLGGVNQSGANVVDTANSALKVNVVAGGAGGGVADTQVRDIAGAWHDVGYRAGTDLNMPVAVQAGSVAVSGSITTLSGSQMDIKNFPTVQTVNVLNMPAITGTVTANQGGSWTTASGSIVDIKNFPTVQTVNVQNLPNLTSVSGTNLHAFVDNIPNVQTVQNPTAGDFLGIFYDTTDTVYSGVEACRIQQMPIVASSSGLTTVISGVANKVIKVLNFGFMSNGTVNIDFRSAASVKQLTGLLYEVANTGYSSGYNPKGHFWSEVGEGIAIELSAAVGVGGYMDYITV